jgi:hypothetical protein
MRTSGIIFVGMTVFFAVVTPIYWLLSGDPTGTTVLVLTFGLTAMLAFYLMFVANRMGGSPPEDRPDGEIYENAGELGFFAPKSWTPLYVAGGSTVLVLGLVFGWWLALIGLGLLTAALFAWVYEFYRGEWAH